MVVLSKVQDFDMRDQSKAWVHDSIDGLDVTVKLHLLFV